eukprot:79535-Amphidinium_carterae.1
MQRRTGQLRSRATRHAPAVFPACLSARKHKAFMWWRRTSGLLSAVDPAGLPCSTCPSVRLGVLQCRACLLSLEGSLQPQPLRVGGHLLVHKRALLLHRASRCCEVRFEEGCRGFKLFDVGRLSAAIRSCFFEEHAIIFAAALWDSVRWCSSAILP